MTDPAPPVALVLTPVASAAALAGLCSMTGVDVHVVPSRGGAIAVLELPPPAGPVVPDDAAALADPDALPPAPPEWDMSELLPSDDVPQAADDLARTLSRLSKTGVVLLTARLAADGGPETGISGHLSARRYTEGERGDDVPAGLVLAGADDVVENLILGRVRVEDVRGHERSGTLPRWKAAQMFAKGLRRRRP